MCAACMVNTTAVLCNPVCLVSTCPSSPVFTQVPKPKRRKKRRRDSAMSQGGEGQQYPQASGQGQPGSCGDGNGQDSSQQQVR
jgi:hypothetical protein